MNEAFHRQVLRLAEKAVFRDPCDDYFHFQANALAEIGKELQLNQLALGNFGPAFRFGAMLSQRSQLRVITANPAAPQPLVQQPMYRQVRVPPDGRREMTVVLARQGVMLFLLR